MQEVDLVGNDPLEVVADVDVEMTSRIQADFAARRLL